MRKILMVVTWCVYSLCFAQYTTPRYIDYSYSNFFISDNSSPYDVPTPNQSSLGTFGIIPVSAYTGKADVSIPIFKTTQRDVALEVALHYDTSGLLINQLPGWTGHNWTLTAGGAITRKINGRPDELNLKDTGVGRDVFLHESDCSDCYFVMSNGRYHNYFDMRDNPGDYDDIRSSLLSQEAEATSLYDKFTNYFSNAQENRSLDGYKNAAYQDTSADIFYFNFMGISGSFFYGNDNRWKVVSDHNIAVLFDINDSTNYIPSYQETFWHDSTILALSRPDDTHDVSKLIVHQPKTIKGFTLIDENGNRYIFGGDKSSIEYSMPLTGKCIVNTTEPWNAVSWMLKEVRDRFGNILYSFKYSRGEYITQLHNSYNSLTRISKDPLSLCPKHYSPNVCSGTLNAPVYLDEINTLDGTVLNFNHSRMFIGGAKDIIYQEDIPINKMLEATYKRLTFQSDQERGDYDPVNSAYEYYIKNCGDSILHYLDRMNLERLDSISIGHSTSNDKQICNFIYNYKNRIHLNAVVFGNSSEALHSYRLEYDRFDSIPKDYLTKQFDHWGYYNGIDYDHDTIPSASPVGTAAYQVYSTRALSTNKAARVADLNYGTMGMLKKIIYPTGGYSVLEYEQNSCRKCMSDDKQVSIEMAQNMPVGGLRIKSIDNYDQGTLIGRKTYSYTVPGTSQSSGELYSIPNTHYEFEDNSNFYKVDIASSVIPLANSFSPTVGYTYVTETDIDGTSTTYEYSNFSSEKDEFARVLRYDTITPYHENSSRRYMCGKILSETKTTNTGDTIQNTKYTYYSDTDYNAENYVTTTSFNNLDIIGCVGNIYKLFYFKTGVKDIIAKTKYGNNWVTDSIHYDRQHRHFAQSSFSDYSNSMDVSHLMSTTVSRAGSTLRTEYTYPYMDTGINLYLTTQFLFPVTGVKRYENGLLRDGTKTTYRADRAFVPSYDIAFTTDENACDTIAKYKSYTSTFRVAEMIDRTNTSHRYYWNDQDKIVVEIVNAPNTINLVADSVESANSDYLFASKPIDSKLFTYDDQGRVSKIKEANGAATSYEYDTFDRLTKVYDTNGKQTKSYSYKYNSWYYANSTSWGARVAHTDNGNILYVNYKIPFHCESAEVRIHYLSLNREPTIIPIDTNNVEDVISYEFGKVSIGRIMVYLYINGEMKDRTNFLIQNYI